MEYHFGHLEGVVFFFNEGLIQQHGSVLLFKRNGMKLQRKLAINGEFGEAKL